MAPKRDEGYEVGYGRPPRDTQFATGVSGNPKGRPKGSVNIKKLIQRTLHERVTIKEKGRTRTISKLEAALKQLTNRAASGDHAAFRMLMPLLQFSEDKNELSPAAIEKVNEADEKVLESFLTRLNRSENRGKEGDLI